MIRKSTLVLAALVLAGAILPGAALANDPAPNTKDGTARTEGSKPATSGPIGSPGADAKPGAKSSGVSTGNPRSNPANDSSGPRATESRTDATPKQGTPAAEKASPPR